MRTTGNEHGISLAEVIVVMAVFALFATAALSFALPWLGREEMRGAIYQVQQALQIGRGQAITRNRDCRFLINTATRQIDVVDLNDPLNLSDDILLQRLSLSDGVSFARPDVGAPVTLALLSGTTYQATFASDGSVTSGAGLIALQGGDANYRVNLFAAGGVRVERWNGSTWVVA
jgi:prepilin-type N-terminal cleavage/methylation domain-containing protein